MMDDKKRLVTVCSNCLTAQCWHAGPTDLMCEGAGHASLVEKTVEELDRLNLEHPSYYALERVERICGKDHEYEKSG